jgi:hypothetical protein
MNAVHRHHIENRLINIVYCLALFVWLVQLVAAAKMLLETKHLKQAHNKTCAIYFSLDIYDAAQGGNTRSQIGKHRYLIKIVF